MIDKSEKDWWKGKCLGGRAGYFPSAYVMRVESGQKTLQVTRNLQLADQTTLLRDQVMRKVCGTFNYSARSHEFLLTRLIQFPYRTLNEVPRVLPHRISSIFDVASVKLSLDFKFRFQTKSTRNFSGNKVRLLTFSLPNPVQRKKTCVAYGRADPLLPVCLLCKLRCSRACGNFICRFVVPNTITYSNVNPF